MRKVVRLDSRPHMATLAEGHGFIVKPRWRLVFQSADTDDPVTPEAREQAGNAGRLATSLKRQVVKFSWRAMHPLRRAG